MKQATSPGMSRFLGIVLRFSISSFGEALHNPVLLEYYGVEREKALGSVGAQEKFFFRIFPEQVEVGPNKPNALDWLLSRTRDGAQTNAPRELIHFLNSLRVQQMHRYESRRARAR